jgi:hypothetical protein
MLQVSKIFVKDFKPPNIPLTTKKPSSSNGKTT